ncbi:hypothetical protein [Ureibacillus thermophilus]|uniref:Uncharacterized protein n=2 Tax=Ureibacillus thermophilus TaxID=367743 RepID=A0A4P6USP1_9BACL|nr:hypothetical protein [Ureibacillus thermophilus]QBK25101.1 hypothetical protein DKZ56_04065 [Ureibacillus thermophilus]
MYVCIFNCHFIHFLLAKNNNQETKSNTIKQKNLSDEERNRLMAAVGGKIFHYEYKAEKEKLLRVWVERYEYGNLVEQAGDIGGIIENEEEKFSFIF